MPDALLVVLNCTSAECGLIDDFANILENEFVGLQVCVCTESEPLFLGLDDGHISVLFALKPLILALVPTVAVSVNTLHFGGPIDTVRVFTTGMVHTIP